MLTVFEQHIRAKNQSKNWAVEIFLMQAHLRGCTIVKTTYGYAVYEPKEKP